MSQDLGRGLVHYGDNRRDRGLVERTFVLRLQLDERAGYDDVRETSFVIYV